MRIVLTGASSFTGFWFARALVDAGHVVVAPLRGQESDYSNDVRGKRVRRLGDAVERVWGTSFGSPRFLELVQSGDYDLLCHHAARVGDYRNPEFDVAGALAENVYKLPAVITAMQERGLKGIVLTGSVFEQYEGAGELPMRAFSPYGVSKGLTADVFEYWCAVRAVALGKFVIPNPFGPFEEPRFTAYLMRTWNAGQTAEVRTPAYVRDNIHVGLLACAYARFAETIACSDGFHKLGPSGYVETQGAFAERFAREVRARRGLECRLSQLQQVEFSEPRVRINTHPTVPADFSWDEGAAWDDLVNFYVS